MESSKEVILHYLRLNRGREIPVSEIKEKCELKLSTISNAIKELQYLKLIQIERRPLKRGKYTVIRLRNDFVESRYIHPKEYQPPINNAMTKSELIFQDDVDKSLLDSYIGQLISKDYNLIKFTEEITEKYPNNFQLVVTFITPLLIEVGRKWEGGFLTTAEEHIISSRLENFIISLIPINMNSGGGTMVLVPVEGEEHIMGLIILEMLLVEKGYHVINLGRQLPIKSLIQYIDGLKIKPDWILFSITLEAYVGTLLREIREIKDHFKNRFKIAVGGQGIQNHQNCFIEVDTIVTSNDQLYKFLNQILPNSLTR